MVEEIERKFLLRGEGWRGLVPGTDYVQGYLAGDGACTVRVRIVHDSAKLSIKIATTELGHSEFEYFIPLEDARQMLVARVPALVIEKTRYVIEYKGFYWEIDEFHGHNQGLIVAEIELEHMDQPFEKPAWIGAEVTGDPRYYNINLARVPYSEW